MTASKPLVFLACGVLFCLALALSLTKNRRVDQNPAPPRVMASAAQAGLPVPAAGSPGEAALESKPIERGTTPATKNGSMPGPTENNPALPNRSPEKSTAETSPQPTAAAGGQNAPALAGTQTVPHLAKRGESVASLARQYLAVSAFMRRTELEDAIREANGLRGDSLRPGETVMIPGIPAQPILDKPVLISRGFEVRGIYLTGYTAGSAHGLDLIERWKAFGGNAVVFDVKDYDGEVRVPFDHRYAPRDGITIRNLPKFAHYLHSLQLHSIARIALFRDAYLAENYPALAVRSRRSGKPWVENGKLAWLDPSNPEVQQYNLDLARLAAQAGVDEIQFDYMRFPAEGDQADTAFAYQKEHPEWPRSEVITDFVGSAYQDLHALGVLVSIDVFGVMAWQRPIDLSHTGQDIPKLARQCDVLSPMVYPSHFFHMEGYDFPGNAPEHFISESMQRFAEITQGSDVVLRPWLQAFGWRTKSYSVDYVMTEVRVAREQGGVGFMFWNAGNDYSKPIAAMPEMRAAGNRYFQGDELGKKETATATGGEPSQGKDHIATRRQPRVASRRWRDD